MLNAKWSTDTGRIVDFRLIEQPGEDRVNPFKQYQRRRGGRIGQSFHACIVPDGSEQPAYDDAVMLAGWGDDHAKGLWVRFWIDPESTHHPFAGYARKTTSAVGQLFAAVIVLTEEPGGALANNDPQALLRKQRALSSDAHLIITGQRFLQYLTEKSEFTEQLHKRGRSWDSKTAKQYVKWCLNIESLSELDRRQDVAERFHAEIRRPFSKWNGRE